MHHFNLGSLRAMTHTALEPRLRRPDGKLSLARLEQLRPQVLGRYGILDDLCDRCGCRFAGVHGHGPACQCGPFVSY